MLNMVQGFATLERIGSYGISNIFPSAEAIRNIQISDILPSDDDETALKDELAIIVSRILTTYVPAYADLDTVWSIPHQYSKQSTFKSETVPLGILNKNESSTAGIIEILENYKEYVFENENGDPLALLLYCNGLSCERVEGAQRARINGADRWERLDLFKPAIQEWHRRLMFLQDTYDELFKFESHREKGTLYNLKQVYDHKGVTKNVMDCFDKAEELLEFVTEGYIILYAMERSGMAEMDDTPKSYPHSPEERQKYRDDLSRRIVELIYEKPNTKEVIHVAAEPRVDGGDYCICQLDAGGAMVYCNNRNCPRGSWFHLECLGMEEDDVPEGEWFCSEECRMDFEQILLEQHQKD